MESGIYDLEIRPVGQQEACLDIRGIVVEPGDCTDAQRQIPAAVEVCSAMVALTPPGGRMTTTLRAAPGGALSPIGRYGTTVRAWSSAVR
jgi:hypothetical protein